MRSQQVGVPIPLASATPPDAGGPSSCYGERHLHLDNEPGELLVPASGADQPQQTGNVCDRQKETQQSTRISQISPKFRYVT